MRPEAVPDLRSAGAILCRVSMTPALFVEFGSETLRHLRRSLFVGHVALSARHAGATAAASVLAFPWLLRVVLTNPSAIFANEAFHRLHCLLARGSRPKFGRTSEIRNKN
jgi:hypothetical protein